MKIHQEETYGHEGISENDNWKLKYYNDMDMKEKAIQEMRERLAESKENEQILGIEVEELRKEIDEPHPSRQQVESGDYLTQLKTAQDHLIQHNQHINRLLEQIQLLKDAERKYMELLRQNDALNQQIADLRKVLSEKETEMGQARQQERLNLEISDRINKAHSEFTVLRDKLQKLETYLQKPNSRTIEYDDLHESYFKLSREFDEVKARQISLWEENQRLSRILSDTEDKLREANFQRQQLQKKAVFLEELNKDLQEATEHHKKLDSQLRRLSEMESMLAGAGSGPADLPRESLGQA